MIHWFFLRATALTVFLAVPCFSQSLPEEHVKSELARHLIMSNLNLTNFPDPLQIQSQQVLQYSPRVLTRITFSSTNVGVIEIFVSSPVPLEKVAPLSPVLFLMSGFQAGGQSVNLLSEPGNVILIGYQYPITIDEISKFPDHIGEALRVTPGQVASILAWITKQPWASQSRMGVMGVSLGTLFLPVSLRIADFQGTRVPATILAFGGSDLSLILKHELEAHLGQSELNTALAVARWVTALHEPARHLPFLGGRFLVVRATHEDVFPESSGNLLENLTPEPKRVVMIEGTHINSDKGEMIEKTALAVKDWLGF